MRPKIARVLYLLTAICVVVGVGFSIWSCIHADTTVYHFGATHDGLEFASTWGKALSSFLYFTIWSNVLIGLSSLLLAIRTDRTSNAFRILRVTSLVMILVTGVVFNTVLLNTFNLNDFFSIWGSHLEHQVVPLLALAAWLLDGPRIPFTKKIFLGSLAIPVIWIAFTLVHGMIPVAGQINDHWYPYPFLDAAVLGYGTALLNIAMVVVLYAALAAAMLGLDKILPGTGRNTPPSPRDGEAALPSTQRVETTRVAPLDNSARIERVFETTAV